MSSGNRGQGRGGSGSGHGAWGSGPPRGRGSNSDSRGNNRGGYTGRGGTTPVRGSDQGRGSSPFRGSDRGRGGGGFRGESGGFRGERGQGRGFTRGTGGPAYGRPRAQPPGLFAAESPASIDTRLQNDTQNQVLATLKSLSLAEKERQLAGEVLPVRPDYGTEKLKDIKLRTNYFPVIVPEVPIFEYGVAITPIGHQKAIGAGKKRRIFQLAEQTKKWNDCGLKDVAHDHIAKILSAKELPDPITIEVDYYGEDEERPPPNPEKFAVVITKLRELALQDLVSHTTGERQYKDFDIAPLLAALNIILASHATSPEGKGIMVGRNKFFFPTPAMVWELGGGLQAFRGFYSSVRPTHYQLMVNVNVCTTAFYKPGNLAKAILEFMNGSFGANPNAFIKPNLKIVITHFQPPRHKTVKALFNKTAGQYKFPCSEFNNESISVAEYFKKKYRTLQYPDLPLVDITPGKEKGKTLVPPEVCEILPNQAFLGKLSEQHTASMIEIAAQPPNVNATAIVDQGLKLLGYAGPSSTRDKFGVGIRPEMAVVPGRILKSPKIEYGRGSKGTPKLDEKASWNLRDVKFAFGGKLENWLVLLVHDGNGQDEFQLQDAKLKETIKGFKGMCQKSGIQVVGEPRYTEVFLPAKDRSDPLREKAMDDVRAVMLRQMPSLKLALVLLSDGDKHIYSGIKRLFDTELDIATVCAHSKKIRNEKGQMQYFANVALKVNMKLGGVNHSLDTASMAWLKKETSMLVGIDVTHPGKGTIRGTPSVAAVVASCDLTYAQYPASMKLQESKVEMVQALDEMMKERLDLFKHKNKNTLPQRIIIYRDGVSEGQYHLVLEKELPKIKEAFQKYNTPSKRYEPKLTIVICAKRHHTRFYPTAQADADSKKYNPLPGTVVDRGVTSIYHFDFFLQAHGGLQGSTKPTHYFVVHDSIGFTADQLQGLTNSVSYMFARATKAVSLVSPAYYADLACERGRCYIHRLLHGYSDSGASTASSDEEEVMKEARKLWNEGVNGKRLKDTMYYL